MKMTKTKNHFVWKSKNTIPFFVILNTNGYSSLDIFVNFGRNSLWLPVFLVSQTYAQTISSDPVQLPAVQKNSEFLTSIRFQAQSLMDLRKLG